MGTPSETLKKVGELFGKIGWDKKLRDLSEDEVVGMIVIMQNLKEIDDEFLCESLAELYYRYRSEPAEDGGVPF